jgi:beta-mannosidase
MSPIAVPDTFNPVQTTMNLLKPSGLAGVDTTNTANTASSRSIRALDSNWSFHQLPSSLSDSKDVREPEWIKVQSMPTSVHVQLLKQGKIVDPYKGLGEWDVQVSPPPWMMHVRSAMHRLIRISDGLEQWVGEADWQFKTTFTVSAEEMAKDHVDLVLDGLDTFCDVELVSLGQRAGRAAASH